MTNAAERAITVVCVTGANHTYQPTLWYCYCFISIVRSLFIGLAPEVILYLYLIYDYDVSSMLVLFCNSDQPVGCCLLLLTYISTCTLLDITAAEGVWKVEELVNIVSLQYNRNYWKIGFWVFFF